MVVNSGIHVPNLFTERRFMVKIRLEVEKKSFRAKPRILKGNNLNPSPRLRVGVCGPDVAVCQHQFSSIPAYQYTGTPSLLRSNN